MPELWWHHQDLPGAGPVYHLQLRLLPLQPQAHLLLMRLTHLLPQNSVLVCRKLHLIVSWFTVFVWFNYSFFSDLLSVCVLPGHTIRELLSSNTEKATMRVLTILRHWVTKHPEVRIVVDMFWICLLQLPAVFLSFPFFAFCLQFVFYSFILRTSKETQLWKSNWSHQWVIFSLMMDQRI